MKLKEVEVLVALAKREGLSQLEYESKGVRISFSLGGPISLPMAAVVGRTPPVTHEDVHVIKGPFVGTFYASSTPGASPFVKVGDKVSPGQVLCIIEAMKIMNEIESDVAGVIVKICVENESLVEYGKDLPVWQVPLRLPLLLISSNYPIEN